MAGDWIKMRGELFTHPRFLSLCSSLIYGPDHPGLFYYVCQSDYLEPGLPVPDGWSVTSEALRAVTDVALRDVTMCALLRVWCSVNSHCKVDGKDAVMAPMSLDDVDQIGGFDGFGRAMKLVGWIIEDERHNSLRFPNFLEFNQPACLRPAPRSNAERQAAFRDRKRGVTKSNASNAREEKRREEKKKNPPNPPLPRNELFDAVAEVSGLDPKTAGSKIGTASATLKSAGYSPSEVLEFGRRFWELCPWARDDNRTRPTPHEIANHIGLIRAGPGKVNQNGTPPRRGQSHDEQVLGRILPAIARAQHEQHPAIE